MMMKEQEEDNAERKEEVRETICQDKTKTPIPSKFQEKLKTERYLKSYFFRNNQPENAAQTFLKYGIIY